MNSALPIVAGSSADTASELRHEAGAAVGQDEAVGDDQPGERQRQRDDERQGSPPPRRQARQMQRHREADRRRETVAATTVSAALPPKRAPETAAPRTRARMPRSPSPNASTRRPHRPAPRRRARAASAAGSAQPEVAFGAFDSRPNALRASGERETLTSAPGRLRPAGVDLAPSWPPPPARRAAAPAAPPAACRRRCRAA